MGFIRSYQVFGSGLSDLSGCHAGNVLSGIQFFAREILDSGLNPAGMTSAEDQSSSGRHMIWDYYCWESPSRVEGVVEGERFNCR